VLNVIDITLISVEIIVIWEYNKVLLIWNIFTYKNECVIT